MNDTANQPINPVRPTYATETIKKAAQRQKRSLGLKHTQALDNIAFQLDYGSWSDLLRHQGYLGKDEASHYLPMAHLSKKATSLFVEVSFMRYRHHIGSLRLEYGSSRSATIEALAAADLPPPSGPHQVLINGLAKLTKMQISELLVVLWFGDPDAGHGLDDWSMLLARAAKLEDPTKDFLAIQELDLAIRLNNGVKRLVRQ